MIKEEIIPIIKEGIRIMTQVNEGLEIEVIGEINYTFEITKHYPIGQLGVSTVNVYLCISLKILKLK